MSSKSWEDIEHLIEDRINEEKQEYDKISGGQKIHSFIAPPTDAYDTKVYVEDKFLHPETCQDQAKYDECVEYYRYVPTSPDFSVSSYCYKQAEIRCVDRKSSSSSKNKWWH